MEVRIYRSSDFGSPDMHGGASGILPMLDACLVNGYGDQTVSITRVGTTAIVTTPLSHGIIEYATITISGADQPEYNGEHKCTITGGNTFTFNVDVAAVSPATGVITSRISGAGWSIEYTATDTRAYKQGIGSNGRYFRVDDSNSRFAHIRGYLSMADINGGVEPFPTIAQSTNGHYITKSDTPSITTMRDWLIVANESAFILQTTENGVNSYWLGYFGDFKSYKTVDVYNTICRGGSYGNLQHGNRFYLINDSDYNGHVVRNHLNQAGSISTRNMTDNWIGNMGGSGINFPNPSDNSIYTSPILISDVYTPLGEYYGIHAMKHYKQYDDHTIIDGTGIHYSGKKLIALDLYGNNQLMVDITGPW